MQSRGYFRLTLFCQALPVSLNASSLWDLDILESNPRIQTSIEDEPEDALKRPREPELISYREFVNRWEQGEMDDVGAFEELLLIACKGMEVKRRRAGRH